MRSVPRRTFALFSALSLAALPAVFIPYGDPWSPSGTRLALRGPHGLHVYDLERKDAPKRVIEGDVWDFAWAPGGPWIACLVAPVVHGHAGAAAVVVVSTEDGRAETVLAEAGSGWIGWSGDGTVHLFEMDTGDRKRFDPPAAWKASHPFAVAPKPRAFNLYDPVGRVHRIHRFDPASGAVARMPALDRPGRQLTLPRDALADGSRFLVGVPGRGGFHTCVVAPDGRTLADLGEETGGGGFSGTSISADGRFVAGNDEIGDGHVVFSERLYLADASGAWIAPIEGAPMGGRAIFSSRDLIVAFQALITDASGDTVHVGRLEIVSR